MKFQEFWKSWDREIEDFKHIYKIDKHELLQIEADVFNK